MYAHTHAHARTHTPCSGRQPCRIRTSAAGAAPRALPEGYGGAGACDRKARGAHARGAAAAGGHARGRAHGAAACGGEGECSLQCTPMARSAHAAGEEGEGGFNCRRPDALWTPQCCRGLVVQRGCSEHRKGCGRLRQASRRAHSGAASLPVPCPRCAPSNAAGAHVGTLQLCPCYAPPLFPPQVLGKKDVHVGIQDVVTTAQFAAIWTFLKVGLHPLPHLTAHTWPAPVIRPSMLLSCWPGLACCPPAIQEQCSATPTTSHWRGCRQGHVRPPHACRLSISEAAGTQTMHAAACVGLA